MTPFEAWHRRNPNVSFLCIFCCVAHIKVTKPNLQKHDDHNVLMVFLRYETGTKAYMLFNPRKRDVHVSREMVFNEKGC